jgi:hypothetical protein
MFLGGGGMGGGGGANMYTGASSYPQYTQRFLPSQTTTTQQPPLLPQPPSTTPAVLPTSSVSPVGAVTSSTGLEPKPAGGMGVGV